MLVFVSFEVTIVVDSVFFGSWSSYVLCLLSLAAVTVVNWWLNHHKLSMWCYFKFCFIFGIYSHQTLWSCSTDTKSIEMITYSEDGQNACDILSKRILSFCFDCHRCCDSWAKSWCQSVTTKLTQEVRGPRSQLKKTLSTTMVSSNETNINI